MPGVAEIVIAVNRTDKPLDYMYDGVPRVLKPGPNHVGYFEAEMAKRQNVRMGTEDPENPRDVEYLVGVEAWGDDISPIEQTNAPERLNREMMNEDAQQATVVRTGGVRAKNRRAVFTDHKLKSPAGLRSDYND